MFCDNGLAVRGEGRKHPSGLLRAWWLGKGLSAAAVTAVAGYRLAGEPLDDCLLYASVPAGVAEIAGRYTGAGRRTAAIAAAVVAAPAAGPAATPRMDLRERARVAAATGVHHAMCRCVMDGGGVTDETVRDNHHLKGSIRFFHRRVAASGKRGWDRSCGIDAACRGSHRVDQIMVSFGIG